MSLSELLAKVGDENLEFQILASSLKSAHAGKKDGSVTFATSKEKVHDMLNGPPKFTCMIVWVPTDKLKAASL
jgi:hypothetical protein